MSSGQYVQAFQTHPNNPLYSLCVGLTFFHMASQKYVATRHTLVLQVQCLCSQVFHHSLCPALGASVFVLPGFLLPVAVRGATWSVSGEHIQPRQGATPDGSLTFGHTLLPEGPGTACAEAGGKDRTRRLSVAMNWPVHLFRNAFTLSFCLLPAGHR